MTSGVPFDRWHKDQLVAHVRGGKSPRTALLALDISFSWPTVKRHIEADDEFRDALADAMADATAVIEDKLYDMAKEGNLGAVRLWLANRGEGWVDERSSQQAAGGGTTSISVTVVSVDTLREALADGEIRGPVIQAVGRLAPGGPRELESNGDSGVAGSDGDGGVGPGGPVEAG